jgi:copper(I)-binding protein
MMRMEPAAPVEIPAGGTVSFTPGGLHVMLTDVPPLAVGDTVELRLVFDRAGSIVVSAPVVEIETP